MHFFHSLCTPYYDNQYKGFINSSGAVSTNVTILHPNIFYFVLDASWSSTNSLEFWNKGNITNGINNNPINKTIYDPSPLGFSLPKSAAFTGFTITGENTSLIGQFNVRGSYNKGWNFYSSPNFTGITIFFLAQGYRDIDSRRVNLSTAGNISEVGTKVNSWSAGTSTNNNTMYIGANSTSISPKIEVSRAFGISLYAAY